jgi:hypothetical protein
VRLLFDFKDDVTRKNTRHLITFAPEFNFMAILHTFVDMDVENLALDNCLLAVALLAAVLFPDDLPLTLTVRTYSLKALDHGSHLAHHGLHTRAIAASALADGTFFSTSSVTTRADH